MTHASLPKVGFACCYTPLELISAAGFVPFRILPLTEADDQAGTLLHDNLCPHAKRVLDRAMASDLPDLAGVVIMNSCDTMRRLAEAWRAARPADRVATVDLPLTQGASSVSHFARELETLRATLGEWSGRAISDGDILAACDRHRQVASALEEVGARAAAGTLPGGWQALQELRNLSVTNPFSETMAAAERLLLAPAASADGGRVPVYLTGNVLPDPQALALLATCGARLVGDDLCTGARQLQRRELGPGATMLGRLAHAILSAPSCARSLGDGAGAFAEQVAARAKASGASGVIAHVTKFCDPYLTRLPALRAALRETGLPVLVLEGDCSLRSLGQHRTRIEAFTEMLGG